MSNSVQPIKKSDLLKRIILMEKELRELALLLENAEVIDDAVSVKVGDHCGPGSQD